MDEADKITLQKLIITYVRDVIEYYEDAEYKNKILEIELNPVLRLYKNVYGDDVDLRKWIYKTMYNTKEYKINWNEVDLENLFGDIK